MSVPGFFDPSKVLIPKGPTAPPTPSPSNTVQTAISKNEPTHTLLSDSQTNDQTVFTAESAASAPLPSPFSPSSLEASENSENTNGNSGSGISQVVVDATFGPLSTQQLMAASLSTTLSVSHGTPMVTEIGIPWEVVIIAILATLVFLFVIVAASFVFSWSRRNKVAKENSVESGRSDVYKSARKESGRHQTTSHQKRRIEHNTYDFLALTPKAPTYHPPPLSGTEMAINMNNAPRYTAGPAALQREHGETAPSHAHAQPLSQYDVVDMPLTSTSYDAVHVALTDRPVCYTTAKPQYDDPRSPL